MLAYASSRPNDPPAESAPSARLVHGGAAVSEIEGAVAEKLRLGRPQYLRYLMSKLRSREDAEDVLQDFSLKAVQGAARLTDGARIDAWLGVTLRNALFDRYRRNAGRRRLQEAAAVEPGAAVEAECEIDVALACLTQATGRLNPEARALIQRAELQQTPLKAIAADLGLTTNNVGVRVYRAREALRREMRAQCAACDHPCDLAARFLRAV